MPLDGGFVAPRQSDGARSRFPDRLAPDAEDPAIWTATVTASDMDLVKHLLLLAEEQASLWEAPQRSVFVHTEGSDEFGPWSLEECSAVLIRWLDAGLVGLYRTQHDADMIEDLPLDEARAVLRDATLWRPRPRVRPPALRNRTRREHWCGCLAVRRRNCRLSAVRRCLTYDQTRAEERRPEIAGTQR